MSAFLFEEPAAGTIEAILQRPSLLRIERSEALPRGLGAAHFLFGRAMTCLFRLTRRGLVLATGALALSPAAALAQAARDPSAEQFVQAAAQKVLAILNQPATAQRSAVFDQAVEEYVDLPKISNFVLGKYGRTITPAQRARFDTVFRRYAEVVYEKRLADYRHAGLKVVGSQVRKPGDVVVHTQLSGGPPGDPLIAARMEVPVVRPSSTSNTGRSAMAARTRSLR